MAGPNARGLSGFYLGLGVAALLGVVIIGYLVLRRPPVSIPANVVVQAADTAGFRGYMLGSDSARLEVTEYADFECPACQEFSVVQMPSIEERLIRTGQLRWRYRDFPLDQIHRNTRTVAHAAACADEQGKYWDMHHRIYQAQLSWARERNAAGPMRDIAKAVGLDLGRYDACMQQAKYAGRIEASKREGDALGVGSTPTFLINGRLYAGARNVGYDMLKAVVDSLAGASGH